MCIRDSSPKIEESNLLGDLFIISLFVAYYDENLEIDEWCFEKLKELKNFLFNKKARFNYIKIEPIFKILKSKIDYLIFKIKYRKEEKRNLLIDEEGNTKMEDGKKIEEISPLFISKENHYFTFFKKTLEHYEKNIDKDIKHKNSRYIENSPISFPFTNIKVSKLFPFNKFLKNEEKSQDRDDKIKKIENFLDSERKEALKDKESIDYFNLLSLQSAFNLYENTDFKLFLYEELEAPNNGFFETFYEKDTKAVSYTHLF